VRVEEGERRREEGKHGERDNVLSSVSEDEELEEDGWEESESPDSDDEEEVETQEGSGIGATWAQLFLEGVARGRRGARRAVRRLAACTVSNSSVVSCSHISNLKQASAERNEPLLGDAQLELKVGNLLPVKSRR